MFDETRCRWSCELGAKANSMEEHFPVVDKEEYFSGCAANILGKIFYFGRKVTNEEVIEKMDQEDFEPATFPELLTFCSGYPDKILKHLVVALGSSSKINNRWVACAYSEILMDNNKKNQPRSFILNLTDKTDPWPPYYCFLGVHYF
jgi:hypothetical protein